MSDDRPNDRHRGVACCSLQSIGIYNRPFRGSIRSTLRLPARAILCLRLTHVVTSMRPRLDSKRMDFPYLGGTFTLMKCAPSGARKRWIPPDRI